MTLDPPPRPRHNQRAYMNSMKTEQFGREFLCIDRLTPRASLCLHKRQRICALIELDPLNSRPPPVGFHKCRYHASHDTYGIRHGSTCFDSGRKKNTRKAQKRKRTGRGTTRVLTQRACACTQIPPRLVLNAFAPPHTIKVPIKGHYGFSTSSNHRESRSTGSYIVASADVSCVVI